MKTLIEGVRKFQSEVFAGQKELFSQLAHGQHPRALFITCSDSRIDPCLLTQTHPGDLFILRNEARAFLIREHLALFRLIVTGS